MLVYVTELTKYFILLCMVLYTADSFLGLAGKGCLLRQRICLFAMQLVCFGTLALVKGDWRYLALWAAVQLLFAAELTVPVKLYPRADRQLLNHLCLFTGIGFMFLSRLSLGRALRQYLIALGAFCIALFLPWAMGRIRSLRKYTWLFGAAGLLLLGAVLILGRVTYGSRISFQIAGVSFQPSELVKLLFVFFLAGALWEDRSLKRVFVTALLAGGHVLVLAASKDLGSALIFFCVFLAMVLAATGRVLYLAAGVLGGALASLGAYRLFDHVQVRVLAWRDPWSYIDDQGFQIARSLFAINGGRWFGMGLGNGEPQAIPFVEADCIFSALCEELGVLFGICLILTILGCFLSMTRIALKQGDRFWRLAAFGLGILYVFQSFLTIGGGIKFIPLTGVTLPFVSSGGTSLLTSILLIFLLLGIQKAGEGEETGGAQDNSGRIIKRTAWFFGGLFGAMILYLAYFTAANGREMLNNSYNTLQKHYLFQNLRGTIYGAGGEILADSQVSEDGEILREYPYGACFAHVVGYDILGGMGLESQYNAWLISSDIPLWEQAANQDAGRKNPGNQVVTTLRADLQQTAREALGKTLRELAGLGDAEDPQGEDPEACRGAAVMTEADTGRVLVMVSLPDFDPNKIAWEWEELIREAPADREGDSENDGASEDSSGEESQPSQERSALVNRVTQGRYLPEVISQLLGTVSGSGEASKNSSVAGARTENPRDDLTGVLTEVLTDDLAEALTESMTEILTGSLSGPSAEGPSGSGEELSDPASGQSAARVTPIRLNMLTCAAARGGRCSRPWTVERIQTPHGRLLKTFYPQEEALLTPEEALALWSGLEAALDKELFADAAYQAAGAAGFVQGTEDPEDSYAWFTGCAPAPDPQVCLTVILEGETADAESAERTAREIWDAYFALGGEKP